MSGFNYKKAVQTLNFFARKEGGKINKMKAIKLIWLSDRLHIRKYARPITDDLYFALEYGPIQSNIKDLAANKDLPEGELVYRNKFIKPESKFSFSSINEIDVSEFSNTDLEVMNEIYEVFGKMDQWKLSDLSHFYPEWKRFEALIKEGVSSRFKMNYLDFFEDSDLINDYFKDKNSAEAKEIFLEQLGSKI